MNTRFELVLHGDREPALRAAGEEALREIARIEDLLSAFRPTSEIFAINAHAAQQPVQVSPELFALLQRLQELHQLTQETFDITVGPLMQCWGLWGSAKGRVPTDAELRDARERVGWQHVLLNPTKRTVRLAQSGMTLDLGGIGKGYALDRAAELLHDHDVTSAFLHGGTSSVIAIGHPPDQSAWRTALPGAERAAPATGGPEDQSLGVGDNRSADATSAARCPVGPSVESADLLLPPLELVDEALSVSSVSTKAFAAGDRTLGHVLDPRTGHPVQHALLSAVIVPEATAADALSTALLVLGHEGLAGLAAALPGFRGLVVTGTRANPEVNAVGFTTV